MRPSEQVARLKAALRAERARTKMLRGRLLSMGVQTGAPTPRWAMGLTPQEAALMQHLLDRWPNVVPPWAIEEGLPKRDHVDERDEQVVRAYVMRIRRRPSIGPDAIETVRGHGYRCSDAFHARYGADRRQKGDNPMTDRPTGPPAKVAPARARAR